MKKSLKQKYIEAGLNYKMEILFIALVSLISIGLEVVIYLFYGLSFFLVIPILLLMAFLLYSYMKLDRNKRKMNEEDIDEFIRIFTFFSIYIEDGYNVYQSLKEVKEYASIRVKARLEKMLSEIEEDKSVAPYVNFASSFALSKIKEVMIAIFEMVDEGSGGAYISQFKYIFSKLRDDEYDSLKTRKLEKLSSLSFLPLLGSGVTMVMLALCLVTIMGGIMDGL